MSRSAAAGLAALLLMCSPAALHSTGSPGSITAPSLSAPVQVTTDRHGIPHLRAANLSDLYFAWGWVSARDRLWQMVYTRAAAEGQTHRWLGNAALQTDGGAQLFRLRERADAIWQRDQQDPSTRLALERYAAGVNALLAEHRNGTRPWPAELARLNERPRDWSPADCELVLLGFGITLDLDLSELYDMGDVAAHGADWVTKRARYENRWIYDTVPDSAALRMWPPARQPQETARRVAALAQPSPAALTQAQAWLAAFPPPSEDGATRASNAFVVGASRAARGKPLLANDPHLGLATPSPFHVIHVNVPGTVDAIGASVAGLPLIASGRNPRVAWGVTAVNADVIDVYADTLSNDLKRVRTHRPDGTAGWADVSTKPFDMHYRLFGNASIPVLPFMNARRYTPHGPVLVWDTKKKIAYSARWTAMEDDRITLKRFIGLERSNTAAELDERASSLVTPCLNMMSADVDGATYYRAAGLLPIRPRTPGPGPVPSDGQHEWSGFVPTADNPHWRVPSHLFAVNGNNRPAAGAYPYTLLGYDWAHDRARRMANRLELDKSVTLADVASVQNDVYSLAAERHL
ncbi:MAG: penicillin acylase family protein, partial [Candidatus Eisenbacteria bacterium]|nr:penicillin acylase family protein [Candidatus Eisenbacteria bacterium]